MLNRRPRAHCWMLAFFIASYQHLLWTPNSIGVSEGPLGRVWLSLPHLVSSCLELYWQLPLPTATGSSNSTELYNRRPLFNHHQAEITVMQLRGHSLPVHHSVVYHGNFSCSSYFISQFPPTRFPLITAIRMCHLLPVHHLEWHFWPGQKVKTQQFIFI